MVVSRNILIALVSSFHYCRASQLTFPGRTGRIGNMGLATSLYNDRDSDLGETLVKTLLETHQVIPDFLQQHIPEGFTADGEGNTDLLKFDADSDNGEGEESGDASADAGGGWGAEASAEAPSASGGWGAPAEVPVAPVNAPQSSAWCPPPVAPVANNTGGWGTPAAATAPAPVQQAASSSWGAPAANDSWGSAPAAPAWTGGW
jgi:ATP-dependent RNA helicase DDX3X